MTYSDFVQEACPKELFLKLMHGIQRQYSFFDAMNTVLAEYGSDGYILPSDQDYLVIYLLEHIFHDDENQWISYFLFDLDLGTKYQDGFVTMNDRMVPLRTPEDLYDLLMNNLREEDADGSR